MCLRTLRRMSDGRAEARLIAGRRGMQVTKSANKDGNALKKYLDGSRRLEPCERRGTGEYSRLGGSSPLRPLLTTWCGCGTCCPQQFSRHKSGEKCAQRARNRAFGHTSRAVPD